MEDKLSLIVVLKRHNSVITHSYYDSLTSYFPFGNCFISRKEYFKMEKKSRRIIYI